MEFSMRPLVRYFVLRAVIVGNMVNVRAVTVFANTAAALDKQSAAHSARVMGCDGSRQL